MKYIEKHPICMIVIGVFGIFLSSIFVKYSTAPSAVTAAFRLLWTVLLMTPMVFGNKIVRNELFHTDKKTIFLSALSGFFLALHFVLWFESLSHTTVASSTTIVCTEVIWVAFGFCSFMKGHLSKKAILTGFCICFQIMRTGSRSHTGRIFISGNANVNTNTWRTLNSWRCFILFKSRRRGILIRYVYINMHTTTKLFCFQAARMQLHWQQLHSTNPLHATSEFSPYSHIQKSLYLPIHPLRFPR